MLKNKLKSVLYITYLGLLEPIPQAQVTPYLLRLSENINIYLLSFEKANLVKKRPEELKQTERLLENNGISWVKLKYHKKPRILSSIYDISIGIIFSLYLIYRYKIKVVHARSNVPIAIGWVLKSITRVKLIYDRRGIMGEDHLEHSQWEKDGLLYRLSLRFERKVIHRSEATIVLTDWMNEHLRKNVLSDRAAGDWLIKTIPCCVDLHLFKCTHLQGETLRKRFAVRDKFLFLYAGSLGTYNLLDEMLDFFKIAIRYIPQAHFSILSHTPGSIAQTCKRKGIEPSRITVAFVPRNELPNILCSADVGIVFRRSSQTARASSPTKFAEYLACGLPVLCGPAIGDLDKIIVEKKIGIVLDKYSAKEYELGTQRLVSLIKEDKDLRARCQAVASELFSLERGTKSYRDIYNKLLR